MQMLSKIWTKWLWIALKIGNLQARVIFSVIYFLLLGPIAILFQLIGKNNPIKNPPKSLTVPKESTLTTIDSARKQ